MRAPAWPLFIGPVVWAVHFLGIYAYTATMCARGLGHGTLGAVVGGATLVAAAVLIATIARTMRDRRHAKSASPRQSFVGRLTVTTAALALLAVLFETLPLLLVPYCS